MIFIDLNKELVDKVSKLGIKAIHGDYFKESLKVKNAVLMTASNPFFSMGGGIDAKFKQYFPFYCEVKAWKPRQMERIGNIIFAITVDDKLNATPEMVEKALRFAIENTHKHEELIIMGCGTGIGGLDNGSFVEILKKVIK